MEKYIRHQVVEMDESMVQRCVLCGEVISDYTNCMYPIEQGPPVGWGAGSVYILPGNPTLFKIFLSPGEEFLECGSINQMKQFEVWNEGYAATGGSSPAHRLNKEGEDTLWEGRTFQEACENALLTLKWDMSYYNKEKNHYWGCRFFDNEASARKSFG